MRARHYRSFRVTVIAWVIFSGVACVGVIAAKALGHDHLAIRCFFSPAVLATAVVFGHLGLIQWRERSDGRERLINAAMAAVFALGLVAVAGYSLWHPEPRFRIDVSSR